jgi:hypothetical protein
MAEEVEVTSDIYVAYLRGFTKARTKAVVTELDFGTLAYDGRLTAFLRAELYAAFALGITDGSSPREMSDRKGVESAVKQIVA